MTDPDVLEQIPGELPQDRLVRAALLMVDCSAEVDPDRYTRTVIRPVDRTPAMHGAYFKNDRMSTCQLAQMAAVRMAGVLDAEATAHEPLDGGISGRQRRLCERYGAWVDVGGGVDAATMAGLLARGRGWWIDDGSGLDVHAGRCVTDAIVVGAMTITADTVEGGQFRVHDGDPREQPHGCTAQRRYTHTWTRGGDGRWRTSPTSRHIIAVQLDDKLPIPVTAQPAVEDIAKAALDEAALTLDLAHDDDEKPPPTLPTGQ